MAEDAVPARSPQEFAEYYQTWAMHIARRFIPATDGDDASVYSDAALGLWKAATRFREDGGAKPGSFVAYYVENTIRDGFRTRSGRAPRDGAPESPMSRRNVKQTELDDEAYSIPTRNPYRHVINRVDLARAMTKLPARDREILRAYYFEGRLLREIAADLRVTESRVSQRLTAARKTMRPYLAVTD